MPQMNFDLEDGQDPVSFVLSKADGDRFIAFMEDCTDAIRRRDQLVEELEAAQDYAEDRARVLEMVREKLGVPSEPHQGMDERILEVVEHVQVAQSRCLSAQERSIQLGDELVAANRKNIALMQRLGRIQEAASRHYPAEGFGAADWIRGVREAIDEAQEK